MFNQDEIREVVARAQLGDREAFTDLTNKFYDIVFKNSIRYTKNTTDAYDVTQDVFTYVLQKIGQLKTPEAFPGWIKKITLRTCLRRIHRERLYSKSDLPEIWEAEEDPLLRMDSQEKRSRLFHLVGSLRQMDRDILTAFYMEGKTIKKIMVEFGIPQGTAQRRLHTARARLRKVLESQGLVCTIK